jgi:hypothetical protein
VAALGAKAAEHVDELGREADMGHHRDAALGQIGDGLGHAHPALELDRPALGLLDHLRRVAEGLGRAFLVGPEGHVDDHQRAFRPAHHRLAVHDHQLERHRQRGLEAVHHHAERIPDQQEIDVGVGKSRGMGVVCGERHDGLAALAGRDVGRGDAPHWLLGGHGNLGCEYPCGAS